MSGNAFRSALAEFGIVAAQGLKGLRSLMELLAEPGEALFRRRRACRCGCWHGNGKRSTRISAGWKPKSSVPPRPDEVARRLMAIPGLGPIRGDRHPGSGAGYPHVQDGTRLLPLGWGLTPRQFGGTGGKHSSGGISKKGDRTLRTLLTVGATAHLRYERARDIKDPWLQALLARRPFKVAAVAYAAKMARIIWAMLVTGEWLSCSQSRPQRVGAGCSLSPQHPPSRKRRERWATDEECVDRVVIKTQFEFVDRAGGPGIGKGKHWCDGKSVRDRDRDTPIRHRASQRAGMIGTRPTYSFRASGPCTAHKGRIHDRT